MSKKKEPPKQEEIQETVDEAAAEKDAVEDAVEEPAAENDEIAKLTAMIAENEDKYMRLAAEYANFRNRTIKERETQAIKCVSDTLKNLLPVMDNLQRALATVEDADDSPVKQGLELICRSLGDAFIKIGVEKIKTENEEFNPNLHEAVMHIDDDAYGENVIAEELQAGYLYKDTVIRHSMVKVAN